MGCTFPRTQRLFSTVTIFITTKRGIQTRMYLSHWFTLELTSLYPQFFVQPRSLHGRYTDVCGIEQAPQRHGSGSLDVRRGVGILLLIWSPSNITEANFFFFQFCCTVVASVRAFTLQRGSSGSQSLACYGLSISNPYPTNRSPWMNMRASLDARRCLIV
jgi:hypothetical protein